MDNIASLANPLTMVALGFVTIAIPIVVVVGTSFVKIVIVLSILRTAIGANNIPPNYVNNVIAASMTIFIMASPVGESVQIVEASKIDYSHVDGLVKNVEAATGPIVRFMTRNTGSAEQEFFISLRDRQWKEAAKAQFSETSLFVVIPSFILSEVRKGFEMGFLLYIPFTIIDVVTASILSSLGMQSVSPNIISLPLKLFLFVSINGWTSLFDKLIESYA